MDMLSMQREGNGEPCEDVSEFIDLALQMIEQFSTFKRAGRQFADEREQINLGPRPVMKSLGLDVHGADDLALADERDGGE